MADTIYLAISFVIEPLDEVRDILLAELSALPFDTFEETEEGLIGYVEKRQFDGIRLDSAVHFPLASSLATSIRFEVNEIVQENWNAKWESSFEPIRIENRLSVRAPFHQPCHTDIELIIEPKMSFGTGHHQTTYQMLEAIDALDLRGKSVLDVGCGTAVLGILAAKKGASPVEAFDCDDWCVENSLENAERNAVSVKVWQAKDFSEISRTYDVLFANINRNVLLDQVADYARVLASGGVILISGFYSEDLSDLKSAFESNRFSYQDHSVKDNWVCAKFII
jgi:ribosomal protein L11 methyltransferase